MIELEQTISEIDYTHFTLMLPCRFCILLYYPFDTVKCIKNILSLSSVPDSQIGLVCIINFNLTNIFWCQILLVKNYSYIRAVILENCEQCYPYLIFLSVIYVISNTKENVFMFLLYLPFSLLLKHMKFNLSGDSA